MRRGIQLSVLVLTAGMLLLSSACKKENFTHQMPGHGTGHNPKPTYVYLIGYSTADKEFRAYNTQTKQFTTIAKVNYDIASLRTMDLKRGIYYFSSGANSLSIYGLDVRSGQIVSNTACDGIYALEYSSPGGKMYGPVSNYLTHKTSIASMNISNGNIQTVSGPTCSWSSSLTTFDPGNDRYIAMQSDETSSGTEDYIRVIDVKIGNLIASYAPAITLFDYNTSDGKLYGWKGYGTSMNLASMDLSTGNVTDVSTAMMGNISSAGNVIDPVNQIFYADQEGVIKGISLKTGEIVHDFDAPDYFTNWEVYVTNKKLEKGGSD